MNTAQEYSCIAALDRKQQEVHIPPSSSDFVSLFCITVLFL